MKLIQRNIDRIYYTEYIAKAGETLKQIAKDQLGNESLANQIFKLNNNNREPLKEGQNLTGLTLLIPPVPEAFLAKHPNAKAKLDELRLNAINGKVTIDAYYAQRKLILSVL